MTRAVLFDFYGTLARAVAWGPTVAETLARHGLVLDPAAEARWNAESADGIDHTPYSADRAAYQAWELARFRRLAEGCGAPQSTIDALVADLHAASKDYVLEAYDEVPATLAQVRRRNLTVAVCSNWDWDLDAALAATGLDHLVDVAVTSAQAGVRKPHPRIYEITLRRCRVRADEALFVGDSWTCDVEGPRRAGIPALHLDREAADLTAIFSPIPRS